MPIALEHLDEKKVAVELTVGGTVRTLRGIAQYVRDPDLGECLRVPTGDEEGHIELLLRKDEWSGTIEVDTSHGCDYRIRLNQTCSLQ